MEETFPSSSTGHPPLASASSDSRDKPARGYSLFEDWQSSEPERSSSVDTFNNDPLSWQQPHINAAKSAFHSDFADSFIAQQPPLPVLSIPTTLAKNNPFSPVTPAISKPKSQGIVADPSIPDSDPFTYPWNLLDITQTSQVSGPSEPGALPYTPSYESHSTASEQESPSFHRQRFYHESDALSDALSAYSKAMSRQPSPAPSVHESPLEDVDEAPLFPSLFSNPSRNDTIVDGRQNTLMPRLQESSSVKRSSFLGNHISISPPSSPRFDSTNAPSASYTNTFLTSAALESPAFSAAANAAPKTALFKLAIPNEHPAIEVECATATDPNTARPNGQRSVLDQIIADSQQQDSRPSPSSIIQSQSSLNNGLHALLNPSLPSPKRGRSHSEADVSLFYQPSTSNSPPFQQFPNRQDLFSFGQSIDPRFMNPQDNVVSPISSMRNALAGDDVLAAYDFQSHNMSRSMGTSAWPFDAALTRSLTPEIPQDLNQNRGYSHRPTQSDGVNNFYQQPYAEDPRIPPMVQLQMQDGMAFDAPQAPPYYQSFPAHLSVPNSEGFPSPTPSQRSFETRSNYGTDYAEDGSDLFEQPLHSRSQTTKATKQAAAARRKIGTKAKYVCEHCSETFTRNYNLRGHLRAHNGSKPFACTEPGCDKAFARAHDLKRHSALHSAVSKYQCLSCERSFKRLDALQRHHRSEAGQICVAQLLADGITDPQKNGLVRQAITNVAL